MKTALFFFFSINLALGAVPDSTVSIDKPPSWAKEVIWYQIFVERFCNGDTSNDPRKENIDIPPLSLYAPQGWKITRWQSNWYQREEWAKNDKPFYNNLQFRRYGGDLEGVLEKLDYLQDLGVTGLFFNPLNDAPSLHKYDARNYHHIDVNFGPDPEGDIKVIQSENPADPSTWKWTSADKLFLKVVSEAHKRGMKVIMDFSWNHTGVMFWAWQDILKNQAASAYKDWYGIVSFDNPSTPANEFKYKGWNNVKSLPEIKKTGITTERINGKPYEGDINPGAKEHIFAVTMRWMAPDGNINNGIDGFRLDVADQIGLKFWRDYRKFVRSINPQSYLVGEIWWEKWPDVFMNPVPYLGNIFDAVMFYQVYRPARYFFAKTDFPITAQQFKDSLELQWKRLNSVNLYAMMNTSSTHDAPRLLTDFYNTNKYKYKDLPRDEPLYKTGKPDEDTYKHVQLYLVHLFTTIGSPQIWNGEEMGMWGADDPDCRKPLWWNNLKFDPETCSEYQPRPDQNYPAGFNSAQF
ncbi:MAG TPA: alpha-amylase family glycosyl hydrolase, partial [Ignavibacteriaceae bacterium]|nr:alpha-amylase family glycosyl hydrolase [Ignavibacteriaceae bacterium]